MLWVMQGKGTDSVVLLLEASLALVGDDAVGVDGEPSWRRES